ncbi:Carnitine O-acetyltransferase [Cryptotermes secundus]|uniref:Carnitine O-acetyltransferase n=1 Tax=Cryptotermes secundus TaxID=105785 RepID=A0A2J7RPZ4_9NEOP|nr:carnitine O-acetyltransferase-like [Cryptotermes secundus]PNF42901.1 Carnitine O-acetyltransferase [Cryptotermes secundus]
MLRVVNAAGQSMFRHVLSGLVNNQKNGASLLRVSACYPQMQRHMSAQHNFPRHPVPPLTQTLAKFVRSVQPLLSPSELSTTKSLVKDFEEGDGQKLQQILENRARNMESWLADWWLNAAYLAYRLPVVVHSNPALVFPRRHFQTEEEFLKYAADLTYAALNYKSDIDNDKIPIDKMGKQPLDMTQYKRIYGTCRIPAPECDKMHFTDPSRPVHHIVVARNNNFFKFCVYDSNGEIISPAKLLVGLKTVLNASEKPGEAVGILTSEHRDTWARVHSDLVKDARNRRSVEAIQTSLFLLCLDGPTSNIRAPNIATMDALKMIHGGGSKENSGNRWFDKTIEIVVGEEGEVGITVEHSPAEAVPIAMLMNYCLDFLEKMPKSKRGEDTAAFPKPEKLQFNISSDIKNAIEVAQQNLDKLVEYTDFLCCTYSGYGKNLIKEFKVSPDSYIQMALQLAYYRLHNEPAAHYESAGTRLFHLGRTEAIRSCSVESVHFAKTMLDSKSSNEDKKQALVAAVKSHKDYATQAALGQGVDRHLLGLKLAAIENGMQLHPLYRDPSIVRSTHFKITSSQVAGKGNSVMCYGPVVPDGYAACYNPLPNTLNFGLAAFKSGRGTDVKAFHDALMASFDDMEKVMAIGHQTRAKL